MIGIAIDDEPLALKLIDDFANRTKLITLQASFTNSDLAKEYLQQNEVDFLFLDIQMPDINGIEFYKQFTANKLVIFTTAFSEYAIEGFDVQAVDFLLKPFSYHRFQQSVAKLLDAYRLKNGIEFKAPQNFIMFKEGHGFVRAYYDNILYLESKDDYVKVILENGKSILTKSTTKAMTEKLPQDFFARIHRSYIINKNKIIEYDSHKVTLKNGIDLPIGALYKFQL